MARRDVVVSGWGQVTQRKEQTAGLRDPLGLMVEAARLAGDRAGSRDLLRGLDGVMVVQVMSASLDGAAMQLAGRLGANPRFTRVSEIGGSSPQLLVNRAAGMIARGELDRVLVAGGEAYVPRGEHLRPPSLFQGLDGSDRDDMVGSSEVERRHGVRLPLEGFPLLETALWAESGLPLDVYLAAVAERWSAFSRVAARHPNAWSRAARSADEIVTPTAANRRVAFPYTKYMTSLLTVDLAAAVLLEPAGARTAPGLGPVYVMAGACADERQRSPIDRDSFTRSPALRAAARRALDRAGLEIEQVEAFDLYSCFPCAVAIAMRELGLSADDPRELSLTGGLGFFGGPGNAYGLHSIATLAGSIAEGVHEVGLATGLSWFMHKHAVGIYGDRPGRSDPSASDLEDERLGPVGGPPRPSVERVADRDWGTVETYTVLHGRDGAPERAIVYGTTSAGPRFVAVTPPRPEVFAELESSCQVGRPVRLHRDAATDLNIADLVER